MTENRNEKRENATHENGLAFVRVLKSEAPGSILGGCWFFTVL